MTMYATNDRAFSHCIDCNGFFPQQQHHYCPWMLGVAVHLHSSELGSAAMPDTASGQELCCSI